MGRRQVHFRATGQIDSSAFIFFRLRSGSCLEAGEGVLKWWERQTGEWETERWSQLKKERIKRTRCLWLCFSSISLFFLFFLLQYTSPSFYSTANTTHQDSLLHQIPSWKLAQGQASRFPIGRANGFLLLFWRVPVYPLWLLIIHYSLSSPCNKWPHKRGTHIIDGLKYPITLSPLLHSEWHSVYSLFTKMTFLLRAIIYIMKQDAWLKATSPFRISQNFLWFVSNNVRFCGCHCVAKCNNDMYKNTHTI